MRAFLGLVFLCLIFSCATSKKKVFTDYEGFENEFRHLVDEGYQKFEISPNGDKLLLVTENHNNSFVTILSLPDLKPISSTAMDKFYYVRQAQWVDNDRYLINSTLLKGFLKKNDGANDLLVLIKADGSQKRILYPLSDSDQSLNLAGNGFRFFYNTLDNEQNVRGQLYTWQSGKRVTQLFKLNVNNKKMTIVDSMRGKMGRFYIDNELRPRLFIQENKDNSVEFLIKDKRTGVWKKAPKKNSPTARVAPIRIKGNTLFAFDYGKSLKQSLYKFTLGKDSFVKKELVFAPKNTDLASVGIDYLNLEVMYVDHGLGRPKRHYVKSSKYASLQRELDRLFPKKKLFYETHANGKFIFKALNDRTPRSYYLFDLKTKNIKEIAKANPKLSPKYQNPTKNISLTAPDGTKYYAILTLPKEKKSNYPLIVNVHGGPFGVHESWSYHFDSQLLASRGFAVLRVNYRGSGYLGHDFYLKGKGQIGKKMQEDLLFAVKSVIKKGYTKKGNACLWGASYGAYASVMSLSLYPEYFKCAAAFGGLYDLTTFIKEGDIKYSEYAVNFWKSFLPKKEKDLISQSPINNVQNIKGEVLLMHGTEDARCDVNQSRQLTKRLKEHSKKFEYIEYPGTGHWFSDKAKMKGMYMSLFKFMERNLVF